MGSLPWRESSTLPERAAVAALDALGTAVLVVDPGGTVRWANPAAALLFGRAALPGIAAAELLRTVEPHAPPLDVRALSPEAADPLLGPGTDALARRADGSLLAALVATRPLDSGERVVVVRDVSAFRREASARALTAERNQRLLETARVIPWEADVHTTDFTYVGPQAEPILGYPLSAWYQHNFWGEHLHPEDRDAAIAYCVTSTERETHYDFEYRMFAADGRVVWIHDLVVVTRWHGRPQLITGYMIDVTPRKRAEEELRQALRLRDEFLSVAAHELRTPVTPLRLGLQFLSQLLEREGTGPSARRALDVATRQLDRFQELVERLLEVSRLRAGGLALAPRRFDLAELVSGVVTSLQPAFTAAGCTLTLQTSGPVEGEWDRARLEQVTRSLLANALRYGCGEPVEVRVTGSGERARLEVRDQGIGIAPEDAERIFRPFERAAPVERFGGLGLGLYIAHELVTAHGGTLRVESGTGKGATFVVDLPCTRESCGSP